MTSAKVLRPMEYSGDNNGDYGYEIDGVKSEKSYGTKAGAQKALERALEKLGC